MTISQTLRRWLAPLLGGFVFLFVLMICLLVRTKTLEAGIAAWIAESMLVKPVKLFGVKFILTLLLPFYLVASLSLWGLALAWTSLFKRNFSKAWTFLEGLLFSLSAMLWVHALLWWQVPSTLWLIPGLRQLPFFVIFPILFLVSVLYPLLWARKQAFGRIKATILSLGLLAIWSATVYAPQALPRLLTTARGGNDQATMLIIGLDGLRADVGQAQTTAFKGVAYENSYTVLPATRLLWHILWGGDPLYYTVGHAPPALEEYTGAQPLPLIDRSAAEGWKPRFYIDDGGTIGLLGRPTSFDDMVMPAPGWENFVNSNLSASFPLFAVWENWGRAFPTTNPWAPLDGGLKEALRLGRGSRWVMFHSCLAHQPIFLRRFELQQLPNWWTARPGELEPYSARIQVTPNRAEHYDTRRDPFTAYRIRMSSILKAWEPIWNGLDQDPHYGKAVRVLFSDHGERFHHATEKIRLAGVHGFNLDPWECRVMFKAAGPGFSSAPTTRSESLSLLSLRDGFLKALETGKPFTPEDLEKAYPIAPIRYQVVDTSIVTTEPAEYRRMDLKKLVKGTAIAPGGIWFTQYEKPAAERAEDVSLAWGEGKQLKVILPLKERGAHLYTYEGYELKTLQTLSEEQYKDEKQKMIESLTKQKMGGFTPKGQ